MQTRIQTRTLPSAQAASQGGAPGSVSRHIVPTTRGPQTRWHAVAERRELMQIGFQSVRQTHPGNQWTDPAADLHIRNLWNPLAEVLVLYRTRFYSLSKYTASKHFFYKIGFNGPNYIYVNIYINPALIYVTVLHW